MVFPISVFTIILMEEVGVYSSFARNHFCVVSLIHVWSVETRKMDKLSRSILSSFTTLFYSILLTRFDSEVGPYNHMAFSEQKKSMSLERLRQI